MKLSWSNQDLANVNLIQAVLIITRHWRCFIFSIIIGRGGATETNKAMNNLAKFITGDQ